MNAGAAHMSVGCCEGGIGVVSGAGGGDTGAGVGVFGGGGDIVALVVGAARPPWCLFQWALAASALSLSVSGLGFCLRFTVCCLPR